MQEGRWVSAPLLARQRVANALAAVGVVWIACLLHAAAPWNEGLLAELHFLAGVPFTGREFLWTAAAAYSVLVAAWMLAEPEPHVGKSQRFFLWLVRLVRAPREMLTHRLQPADRVALLATLLKVFFGPLMAMSLMSLCMAALHNGGALLAASPADQGLRGLFDRHGFWFAMQLILFVDVAIFTVGYLVEAPRLRNEIRSVDPTLLGWTAALLCYPPFNQFSAAILGAQQADFPQFTNTTVHLFFNGLLLALMAAYAAASVALGLKASNLTHRGVVARGPYAVVRHPAYTCKNLAWWIGSAPMVVRAFEQGAGAGALSVASVAGWTLLYVLRALTEEDHLRRVDGEYAAYAARVRYRFVPGLV